MLCMAGTWAFVSQNSTNFEVALATALVPLLRYVKEARIPVAKPIAARFLPDETFTQASGGYKIGIFLPGVTKVWLCGKQFSVILLFVVLQRKLCSIRALSTALFVP